MTVPKKTRQTLFTLAWTLSVMPIILCLGLVVFGQISGTIYYQRATELRRSIKPGMSRTEVYRELDRFWLYTIWRPDINPWMLCDSEYPGIYLKEVAQFAGPLGLRPGGISIYMCFDDSGRLVFVK